VIIERVEVKDVRVPEKLMRAMAAEAEAAREARANVIAAEGEHKASRLTCCRNNCSFTGSVSVNWQIR
jgi:regulator of protease activity HflC (stomatin/prohibitin superfamily)